MDTRVFEALREKVKEEPYAKMLGLELVKVESGYAQVRMRVRPEHGNIFGRCHGGAIFSLIDEAFQIAANASGKTEVALNVNVSYLRSPREDDVLAAEARLVESSRRIGHYHVEVRSAAGELLASCKALSYRHDEPVSSSISRREPTVP